MTAGVLYPKWKSILNLPRSAEAVRPLRVLAFALLGVAFWALIFFCAYFLLKKIVDIELLGEMVSRKVMSFVFVTFFAFLLLSNMITAFSTYFLADDLGLLGAMPLAPDQLFFARYVENLANSSWHVFLFGLPVLAAYGVVFHAPPSYYLVSLASMVPFLMVPAALAVIATHLLVNIFPARRLRDFSLILVLTIVAAVAVYLRYYLRPERFLAPEGFSTFSRLMADFSAPGGFFTPWSWMVEILFPRLTSSLPRPGYWLMLNCSAIALTVIAAWLSRGLYFSGYSRSQEGKKQHPGRNLLIRLAVRLLALPYQRIDRSFIERDLKLFLRDTTQWTQLLLIISLAIIYLANAQHFRAIGDTGLLHDRELFFLNISLIAFIVASIAVRFVFPAVSMEGRAYWLVRVAPVPLTRVLWAKFLVYFIPLLVLALAFTGMSAWVLRSPLEYTVLAVALIALLTFLATGMGIGLGAIFPRFNVENVAKIPAGYGGIIYMLLSMTTILLVIGLTATAVYIFTAPLDFWSLPWTRQHWWFLIGAIAAPAIALGGGIVPVYLGARSLENRELI